MSRRPGGVDRLGVGGLAPLQGAEVFGGAVRGCRDAHESTINEVGSLHDQPRLMYVTPLGSGARPNRVVSHSGSVKKSLPFFDLVFCPRASLLLRYSPIKGRDQNCKLKHPFQELCRRPASLSARKNRRIFFHEPSATKALRTAGTGTGYSNQFSTWSPTTRSKSLRLRVTKVSLRL